jgi:geranylgeranyl diphosphate synthase type II
MVDWMNFKEDLSQKIEQIEEMLRQYLPAEDGYAKTVAEAMNYSVMAGGKRLRPMLMWETAALFGGAGEQISPFMAALEMIHNYSLVHDDLPAMDNDEYRRGRKTTHVVYGEGMAVLAGDGLLNFAFETVAGAFDLAAGIEDYRRMAKAIQILANKAGIYGMIGGQCADLRAEALKEGVSEEMLLFIHEHKTAALIQAAMMIGAVLAGAADEEVSSVEKCAYDIGIAFQIQDDILDVTGSQEIFGKPIGSDEKNHKLTYVSMHGLKKSEEQVEKLSNEAISILASFPERNLFLEQLVEQLIYREK